MDATQIRRIQTLLKLTGDATPELVADGESGPQTMASLEHFQVRRQVSVTRIFDPATIRALNEDLEAHGMSPLDLDDGDQGEPADDSASVADLGLGSEPDQDEEEWSDGEGEEPREDACRD